MDDDGEHILPPRMRVKKTDSIGKRLRKSALSARFTGIWIGVCFATTVLGQGRLAFLVPYPEIQTRVGGVMGEPADENYLGQLLVGLTDDSLSPVGSPLPHITGWGLINGVEVSVPGIRVGWARVRMVAWDRRLWGEELADVPLHAQGRTDIVDIWLIPAGSLAPESVPEFTRGAVVPLAVIPEPGGVWLLPIGGLALLLAARYGRR